VAEDGLGAEVGSAVVAEGVMVAKGVGDGDGGEGKAMWRFVLQTSMLTWTSTTRLRCKPARSLLHCLSCIVLLVVIDANLSREPASPFPRVRLGRRFLQQCLLIVRRSLIAADSTYDGFVLHLARPAPSHRFTATHTSSRPMSGEANLRRSSDSDDHLRPEPLLSWLCNSIQTDSSSPDKVKFSIVSLLFNSFFCNSRIGRILLAFKVVLTDFDSETVNRGVWNCG
jgi:hypothetical protein